MMKFASMMVLVSVLFPAGLIRAEETPFPPVAYPPDRYDALARRSPFMLATVEKAPAVQPGWASGFVLAGGAQSEGETFIIVADATANKRFVVTSAPNPDGIRLVKIVMNANPAKVVATIEKGGQQADIRYPPEIIKRFSPELLQNNRAILNP
jgi:hypothetical protein